MPLPLSSEGMVGTIGRDVEDEFLDNDAKCALEEEIAVTEETLETIEEALASVVELAMESSVCCRVEAR